MKGTVTATHRYTHAPSKSQLQRLSKRQLQHPSNAIMKKPAAGCFTARSRVVDSKAMLKKPAAGCFTSGSALLMSKPGSLKQRSLTLKQRSLTLKPVAGRIGEDNVPIINSSDDILVKKNAIITEVVDNQADTKRRTRTNLRIREDKRWTINNSDDIILKKPAAATKKKDIIFKKPAETETETQTPAANCPYEPWTRDMFPRRRALRKRPATDCEPCNSIDQISNSPDSNDHDRADVPHYDEAWPVDSPVANYGQQINFNSSNIRNYGELRALDPNIGNYGELRRRSTADGSLPHNKDYKFWTPKKRAHGADPNQRNPDSYAIGDANSDAASRSD